MIPSHVEAQRDSEAGDNRGSRSRLELNDLLWSPRDLFRYRTHVVSWSLGAQAHVGRPTEQPESAVLEVCGVRMRV